jgi:myo-inositol-1-phosphate synthase
LAIYKVLKKGKILSPTAYCKIPCNGTGCKFAPAYEIPRLEGITVDASDSINSQGSKDMLNIYFEKQDDKEYITSKTLQLKFDELGCRKLTLYVRDLNNNKIDKTDIYFKVVDALPVLKDLKMYFPQYAGSQR